MKLRKLMMLGALVAMVVVAAAPALAQVSQEQSERRITSGKSSPSFSVSNKGNNANLCPTGQQVGQTGNVANEQGAVQYQSTSDDIDFSGSSLTITPSETAECRQRLRLVRLKPRLPRPRPVVQRPRLVPPRPRLVVAQRLRRSQRLAVWILP